MIQWRNGGIKPLVMIENRPGAIYVERRPKFLRDPRKIDIFAVKLAVAVMERMHCAKCNSLKREHSQADVKNPDQCDSHRKACQHQSLPMLHHLSQDRVRSQVEKSTADVCHD